MLGLIECEKCKIFIPRHKLRYHERSNLHKSNCILRTEFENIDIVTSAFKNRIVTYRLNPIKKKKYLTPEVFFKDNFKDIVKLIKMSLIKHKCIKVNFELFAYFTLLKLNDQQLKSFNTKYDVILTSTDIKEWCMSMSKILKEKFTDFEHRDSGWSLKSISHLEINVNK